MNSQNRDSQSVRSCHWKFVVCSVSNNLFSPQSTQPGKQHNSNANNNHNQPTSTTGGGMDYGTANTDEYGAELNKNTMRPSLKMSGCGAYKYSNMHHSGSTGNNNVVPNRAASGRNNSSSNSYGRTSDIMKRPIK